MSWLLLQAACAPALVVQGSGSEHARRTLQTLLAEGELPGAQYVVVTERETLLELSQPGPPIQGAAPRTASGGDTGLRPSKALSR